MLAERVDVRESAIAGLGLFATERIGPGEKIRTVNVLREVTDESPLRPELGERPEHCAYPDGKVVLWGYPDRHLNHSCDPNAFESYQDGHVRLISRRTIQPGEEITVNYLVNNSGGDSWPCRCGSDECLGSTSSQGFFGLPERKQVEFLPLLAEWFVARHRDRIDSLKAMARQRGL